MAPRSSWVVTEPEPTVGGFDLIHHGAPVHPDRQATYSSKLGCFDPLERQRNLKKLFSKHGLVYDSTGKG